jgi:transketolase
MLQPLHHFLAYTAYNLRVSSIIESAEAGSGHPTSCLSSADIAAVLFFHTMRFDPSVFENPNADRFILSKGHASALLYAVWKELGVLTAEDLKTYRRFTSVLEGHPTFRFPYTEAATGSLGIGLSIGVGEALAARIDGRDFVTYVLMGDGELAEGCVWEAAELASYNKLSNVVAIVDCNRLGQSAETMLGRHCDLYAQRFAAFGFDTLVVDGHDIDALIAAFSSTAHARTKPFAIIASTIKGYGIDTIEDKQGYHGKPITKQEMPAILAQMRERFADGADTPKSYTWHPRLPRSEKPVKKDISIVLPPHEYKKEDMIATRKAFGTALAALGTACTQVVSLDGDVKNSTYAEDFERAYPERFIQSFIAEQNMVSMAVGMERRGKIPFVSTFGAFFSRAHDQIRMAAIGSSPVRLVGSHAGVSIGEDGPSQMALEDIALMRALPGSVVLYPSDATSTHALVGCMANYHAGISYLRTTRMATPVLYESTEAFAIGGCKVVREYQNAVACVVAAGVTLFEARKAHDELAKQNVFISIIDLYSIKPLDAQTLMRVAAQSNNRIITVEDHYPEGGLGEAVRSALANTDIHITSLAVKQLPRSGTPQELLAFSGIDAAAVVEAVRGVS